MSTEPRAAPHTVNPATLGPATEGPSADRSSGGGSPSGHLSAGNPFAGGKRRVPGWAVKAVGQLNAGELAEALEYLERHRPDDDVLGRALAGEFARRTAAAEFADRAAAGRVSPPGTPSSPDASGSRRPGA